ncbi:P-loop containing nucleoside triphosphate hydrolase protein [Atractiella rhizophila]|nr:P-loop containing nucleoside triphosphate hydrolase protein [Atractiella rhizophila]
MSFSTPSSCSAFLAHLLSLLEEEHSIDNAEMALLHTSVSARELERAGLALNNLSVSSLSVGLGGKTVIEFERESAVGASSRELGTSFRVGDLAGVTDMKEEKEKGGKGKLEYRAEGVVSRVQEGRITVVVEEKGTGGKELDLPERCRILKLANTVVHTRMVKTLERLQSIFAGVDGTGETTSRPSPSSLTSVLLSLSAPSPAQQSPPPVQFLDTTLNDSQKEAVAFALAQPELALIHGPPGTGKTKTLVEIIRQLVAPPAPSPTENAKGMRVLVCGGSNLSVDNLLERLVPHKLPLIRLGHPARILPSLLTATLDYNTANSSSGQIVKDVKDELEKTLAELKGGKLRGKFRKEAWQQVGDLRKEYRKREVGVTKEIIGGAKIVLCTCHGAGSRQIQNESFDVVIIDEAAQAIEPACWIPILKGRKLILAGDHLQLPPTVKSRDRLEEKKVKTKAAAGSVKDKKIKGKKDDLKKGVETGSKSLSIPSKSTDPLPFSTSLEITMFDRLLKRHGKSISRMLKVQYRMHEKICAFPSEVLYDNELISDESVKLRLLSDLVPGSDDEALSEPVLFIDTAGTDMYERSEGDEKNLLVDSDSKSNENEASLVVTHVETLIEAKIPPSAIAIISPYNAQVALLSSLLRLRYPELEIGSIDGFQGREKEAVIVTLVRSNSEREVGFLKEKRRLNVAMTRAKRHLAVVGDSSTVSKGSDYLKKWMEWLEENAEIRMANEFT